MTKLDAETSRSRLVVGHDEWRGKVRDVLRACIAAGIAVSVLMKVVGPKGDDEDDDDNDVGRKGKGKKGKEKEKEKEKEKGMKVHLPGTAAGGAGAGVGQQQGFFYHEWWVVPKITY